LQKVQHKTGNALIWVEKTDEDLREGGGKKAPPGRLRAVSKRGDGHGRKNRAVKKRAKETTQGKGIGNLVDVD